MEPPKKVRRGPYGKKELEKNVSAQDFTVDSSDEDLDFVPNADRTAYIDLSHNSALDLESEHTDSRHDTDLTETDETTTETPVEDEVDSCEIVQTEEYDDDHEEEILTECMLHYITTEKDHVADHVEPTENPEEFSDDENEEISSDLSDVEELCDVDDMPEEISNNINEEDHDHQPVFPGAAISIGTFMLLLAVFCTKHNITGEGIQELLNIISLVLPAQHVLCTSLHSYKHFFRNLRNPLVYHYYCKNCLGSIASVNQTNCSNEFCKEPFKKEGNYFLEIPVINQLRNLFLQDGFFESLQDRFKRNVPDGKYEDIYDGKLYRSYVQNDGPLNSPENISFTFNTDGAAVFKSSNVSIWPIYLIINELPYNVRMKKENMILAALWHGNQKPSMTTFLKPFLDSMKALSTGVKCVAPFRGEFLCRGFVICGTADLPARSLLCNCIQFNGAYSCWKCEQRGITAKVGQGHTHVYPYTPDSPNGPARTCRTIRENAKQAVDAKAVIKGIKGPTWLMFLPRFDILHGICIDYMHGVLLGVQKLLLRLWFAPEFSRWEFNISHLVCTVDERLKLLRPTLDITRLPRSISGELKYWKASEFRSFLLFYGAIVLKGVLDDEHFSHFILLVNAMHLLLKCGSTEEDVCYAEKLLFNFCENFSQLYDECFLTLNVHQLVHLGESVRQLGPLYTNSCFPFEDNNGFLLKMIRGTQSIDNQITTGISFIQKLPELKQKCIAKGSKEEELYNLINSPYLLKRGKKVEEGIYILGGVKETFLTDREFRAVCSFRGETPSQDLFATFKRMEVHKMIIYGLSYKRMLKRDNSTVSFQDQNGTNFGRVHRFLQLSEDDTCECVAVVEILKCFNFTQNVNIVSVKMTEELQIVPVKNITSSCMFTCLDTSEKVGYICVFPNKLESD